MSDDDTQDISKAFTERFITIKNITKDTLKFVLLDDGPMVTGRPNTHEIERDQTKSVMVSSIVGGESTIHPPKLFGPANAPHKQVVRQVRERHVELKPGKSVKVPERFLSALLTIRCELCAGAPMNPLGRCKFLDDKDHRATWVVLQAGLVSPEQVEIAEYKNDLRLDARTAEQLEENAKSGKHNDWGASFHRPKAATS